MYISGQATRHLIYTHKRFLFENHFSEFCLNIHVYVIGNIFL